MHRFVQDTSWFDSKKKKRIDVPCSIGILMKDIWELFKDLNIYNCHRVCRKANRTTNCIAEKGIGVLDSRI